MGGWLVIIIPKSHKISSKLSVINYFPFFVYLITPSSIDTTDSTGILITVTPGKAHRLLQKLPRHTNSSIFWDFRNYEILLLKLILAVDVPNAGQRFTPEMRRTFLTVLLKNCEMDFIYFNPIEVFCLYGVES